MMGQERDVILNRVLMEIRILFESRNGLTIRELQEKLTTYGPEYEFSPRTIRRDCLAFEYHGLVEPRPLNTADEAWRVTPSRTMKRWFGG